MNIVCCLNIGDKYGMEYVHTLKAMVERHLRIPFDFQCFTDRMRGLSYARPVPTQLPGWWAKVGMFKPGVFPEGSRILFLDVDIVVVDDLTDVFGLHDDFTIIRDWNVPGYNSSAFLMTADSRPQVFEKFDPKTMRLLHGDQDWMNEIIPGEKHFPEGWFTSYRKDCVAMPKGKVVVFHGTPKPHEYPSEWVKKHWNGSLGTATA